MMMMTMIMIMTTIGVLSKDIIKQTLLAVR